MLIFYIFSNFVLVSPGRIGTMSCSLQTALAQHYYVFSLERRLQLRSKANEYLASLFNYKET